MLGEFESELKWIEKCKKHIIFVTYYTKHLLLKMPAYERRRAQMLYLFGPDFRILRPMPDEHGRRGQRGRAGMRGRCLNLHVTGGRVSTRSELRCLLQKCLKVQFPPPASKQV